MDILMNISADENKYTESDARDKVFELETYQIIWQRGNFSLMDLGHRFQQRTQMTFWKFLVPGCMHAS
jgi:hypothetical protein